ncbi:MAG: hypothetical protein ACOC22_04545 [bacterium]
MIDLKCIVIYCKYCSRKIGCVNFKGHLKICNECNYRILCFLEYEYEIKNIGTCINCGEINTLEINNDKFYFSS